MKVINFLIISLCFSSLSSCVFLPGTREKQPYSSHCKMVTRKLTLHLDVREKYSVCNGKEFIDDPVGCLLVNSAVTSASAVISGSVVLVGNTIHWLEYKTSCED